jgi:GntP family gluconate:H+ symporter
VVLIAAGQIPALLPASAAASAGWLTFASNPVFALLLTNIVALPLLFGRRVRDATVQATIWVEAMKPAGTILLSIGAAARSSKCW